VFAPNSAHRAQVTKAGRGEGGRAHVAAETEDRIPAERRVARFTNIERPALHKLKQLDLA
jgi:hypothetical protein